MNNTRLALLAAALWALASASMANDFSTVARVKFVQDCLSSHPNMNVYEGTHKCSCVIDKVAQVFTQREFEDANTGFQLKNLPGDRGGVFRDDDDVMDGIGLFKKVHAQAYKACHIKR